MAERPTVLLLLLALLIAPACGEGRTKDDVLEATKDVTTVEELRAAVGAPTERSKLGPVETWTYAVDDGEVKFVVYGDEVKLKATLDR